MKEGLIDMISGPKGEISSKRVSSFTLILVGIGIAIFCVITKRWEGIQFASVCIGSGLLLQGVTAWGEKATK